MLLSSGDRARHHSLATDLLARARRSGLAGATLLRAREGRGRSGALHHTQLFAENAPLALVVVDDADKISAFLDGLGEARGDALLTVDDVTAFRA